MNIGNYGPNALSATGAALDAGDSSREIDGSNGNGVAAAFRALGHLQRLAIVQLLRQRALACCQAERIEDCTLDPASCNVGGIVTHLGIPAPTASHHLKELAAAGLIERARRGRFLYCRVNQARLGELREALGGKPL